MKKLATLAMLVAATGLAAVPAHAASNPKKEPTQAMPCPHDPGKWARVWVDLGRKWTADNPCGHGTWLSIGFDAEGTSDSDATLVLVAPKTRFGPRKSLPKPGPGNWWGASLTTNPEFHDCIAGETYAVWPDSKGVFDLTC
jgi:hypothetical protein